MFVHCFTCAKEIIEFEYNITIRHRSNTLTYCIDCFKNNAPHEVIQRLGLANKKSPKAIQEPINTTIADAFQDWADQIKKDGGKPIMSIEVARLQPSTTIMRCPECKRTIRFPQYLLRKPTSQGSDCPNCCKEIQHVLL